MRRYMNYVVIAIAVATCAILCTQIAHAQTARTAVLTWTEVTKDVLGGTITGVTYNIYQGPKTTGKQKVATGITSLTYTAVGLPAGEVCFRVSASANGIEGAASNEICKTFSAASPAVPVLSGS